MHERSRLTAAPTDCGSVPSFQDGFTERRNGTKTERHPAPAVLLLRRDVAEVLADVVVAVATGVPQTLEHYLTVFIAGLMVGRTPEYLGKQIQVHEIKLALIGTLFVPLLVLTFVAIAVATPAGRQSMTAHGPQGLAESVYAYLSQAQNNGSAFAGYSGLIQPAAGNVGSHGIVFADLAGGWVMILGRFVPILAVLALAGSLGPRRIAPAGLGTLRTDTPTFVIFLIGFVVVFAVLSFLTALVLAPFAQALSFHLLS
jgi:K+-transporting ATPase ATPase A chain